MIQWQQLSNQKIIFLIVAVLFLSGCSTLSSKNLNLTGISQADLLSGKALFGDQFTDISLPEDKVLKLSDGMVHFLDRYISKKASKVEKFRVLRSIVFSQGNLGMEYDQNLTLTAREAFRVGSGNCLAFSYLFASMARKLDLKVYFQNVAIPPEWSINNNLSYYYRHVNVGVKIPGHKTQVVDIDGARNKPYYKTKRLSERNVEAQYYGNIGVEYLIEKDNLNAFRYFIKAISLDSSQSEFWSNLGVLYRWAGKNDHAEAAYLISMGKRSDNYTSMNNLVSLYKLTGEKANEEKYRKLSQHHYNKNPYYRYFQALSALEEAQYDKSLSLIGMALKLKKKEPAFYYLLGDIYDKTEKPDQAREARAKGEKIEKNSKKKNKHRRIHNSPTWESLGLIGIHK